MTNVVLCLILCSYVNLLKGYAQTKEKIQIFVQILVLL